MPINVPIIMRKYQPPGAHACGSLYCVVNFTVVCVSAYTVLLSPHDSFPYMAMTTHSWSILIAGTNFSEF